MKKKSFRSLLVVFAAITVFITSAVFVGAETADSKYELHDGSWYLSEEEAKAFMGFIYNLGPDDLEEKEFAGLAVDLLSGKYADSPEDEYIIKAAVCEVALTQINSKVSSYDHASVITSDNLIKWLQSQVGDNPEEQYINSTCNGYLGKMKESLKKTILICNMTDGEYEAYEDFELRVSGYEDIYDFPQKIAKYVKDVKAGLEAIKYAGSSSRSAMYKYVLSYVKTRDLANSTVDGFELAMDYNVVALVNQGLYDPFLNWAAEDNQKVLNRFAELLYWLCEDIGGIDFENDNASGNSTSTAEPVEFVPSTGEYKGSCGDKVKWHLDASTGVLSVYGSGAMNDYGSASKTPWYNYRQYINYVKVADGVTNVGNNAFSSCTVLDKVYLSADVTSIGAYAFSGCQSLRIIAIDGDVSSIGSYAFQNCSNLVYFKVPDGITSIGSGAFKYCTNLANIYLPDGITSIGYEAFRDCGKITAVNLTEGLLSIGEDAFLQCYELKTVNGIPSTVTYIGQEAFANCRKLEDSIVIPNGVTTIEEGIFRGCSSIASIEIHNSVAEIGKGAFSGCASVTELIIPESITYLPKNVFAYCTSLKELTIPASMTMYSFYYDSDHTFYMCEAIEKVTLTKGTGTMAFGGYRTRYPWYFSKNVLKEVIIEDGITNIEDEAFYYCKALEAVVLPDSITSIGCDAYNNCTSLTELTIPNKDCTIFDSSSTISTKTTIKAACDSKAYDYAVKYKRSFASTEHTPSDWFADFLSDGETMTTSIYRQCTYCGEVLDLTTHITKGWIVDSAATCTQDGSKHLECLDCQHRIDTAIPALGHTPVTDPAVDATCTETGLTEGSHCSVCGEVLTVQEEIPAKGHTYGEYVVTVQPTCTESGVETKTCSVCGDEQTRLVPALGHKETIDPGVAPTCTESGLTDGSHCSVCNIVLVKQGVIPATGHNDSNSDGICDNCGENLGTHTPSGNCTCICHKGGFMGFIYKIIRIFWKLFGTNKICACGAAHY